METPPWFGSFSKIPLFVFPLKDTGAIVGSNFALDVGEESCLRFRSLLQKALNTINKFLVL